MNNTTHLYTLEPYSSPKSRYHCPQCNSRARTFSRYINTETGEYLGEHVGRCSRENNCGYHFKPKDFFREDHGRKDHSRWTIDGGKNKKGHGPWTMDHRHNTMDHGLKNTIHAEIFKSSLSSYQNNNFVSWLITLFGEDITSGLISKYLIGTSKHWQGATVFWQVDCTGAIRTGKIMLYNADTGKRVKQPFNHITWAHSLVGSGQLTVGSKQFAMSSLQLKQSADLQSVANCKLPTANFNLRQVLFGEHLLKDEPYRPVGIVESEKSAIIASVYLPQFTWLAAGSLTNLDAGKCAVLKARNVTLFPDLNCFDKWKRKAKELAMGFKVSDLLETSATETEKQEGMDLADYLLKFNPAAFAAPACTFDAPEATASLFADSFNIDINQIQWRVNRPAKRPAWDKEISELQQFYSNTQLPEGPLRLNPCTTINNVKEFASAHFEMVQFNNGKYKFLPYLQRLKAVKKLLEIGNI
jgi:hypothetical protein